MDVRSHAKAIYLLSMTAATLLSIYCLTNGGLSKPSQLSFKNALLGFMYFGMFNAIGAALSIARRNLSYITITINVTAGFLLLMFLYGWFLMTAFIAAGGDKGGGGPFVPFWFLEFNPSWSLSQLAIFLLLCTYLGAGERLGFR